MSLVHLPALQVVLPLLAAPVCFLLGRYRRLSWMITVLVSWSCLWISAQLANQALTGEQISYAFGGWAPPWGIEYRIDQLNALVLLVVSGIAAVVFPYSWRSIQDEVEHEQQPIFFTCMLLCLAGLLGITITGDAFNLFVLLEISSLSSYALISLGRDRRALTASFQYLVMGTIGATFILIGVGILYMLTGTLNIADLGARIPDLGNSRALQAGFGFLVIGIGLKLAMFPLHLWLPNAYAYAPSVVSAFIAATATKVAVYVMVRYLYTIFGPEFSFATMKIHWLFIPVGLISVLFTSIVALFQRDIKRMLAYSSVAQIGYMLVGIGLVSATGLSAALLHLFNHALMKGALFLAMGAVCFRLGNTFIDNMQGIGRQMPWTMAAFLIGGLSLIGVPLTVGFVSKWYLILAALEQDLWPIAAVVLIGSLIALIYVWRVVEAVYLQPRPDQSDSVSEAPAWLLIPTWILVLANIYFGVDASLTTKFAFSATSVLMGGQ
ncbi:MAG: monovalent cation/H+ antiporter subunit D family protein [Gammaproteobacteria bacterium]|jgi:multicomponent Na+:H+ antiporter subunit D